MKKIIFIILVIAVSSSAFTSQPLHPFLILSIDSENQNSVNFEYFGYKLPDQEINLPEEFYIFRARKDGNSWVDIRKIPIKYETLFENQRNIGRETCVPTGTWTYTLSKEFFDSLCDHCRNYDEITIEHQNSDCENNSLSTELTSSQFEKNLMSVYTESKDNGCSLLLL